MHFRGTAFVKQDDAGRIVVPARFRDSLAKGKRAGLVVTGHPAGFLLLLFQDDYLKLEQRVSDLPDTGEESLYFKQTIVGMAEDAIALDKLGRIKLSVQLREHAGLNSEVALVGMGRSIRIWCKERLQSLYSKQRKQARGQSLPEGWDGFKV